MGKASTKKKALRRKAEAGDSAEGPVSKKKSGGKGDAGKTAEGLLGWAGRNWPIITLIFFTFAIRVIKLGGIFSYHDEGDYLLWAMQIKQDPFKFWDYSIHYAGVMPLHLFPAAFLQNFFADPLIANRLVSVLAGCFSVTGLYLIGRKLFDERVGLLAGLLYSIITYFFFWNRFAHSDPLLATFGVFFLYFFLQLFDEGKTRYAVYGGLCLAGGLLTKQISYAFIIFPALALLLLDNDWKVEFRRVRNYIPFLIAAALFLPVFISHYQEIVNTGAMFLITPNAYMKTYGTPLTFSVILSIWRVNIVALTMYMFQYLSLPILIFTPFAVVWAAARRDRKMLFILSCSLVPIALFMVGTFMPDPKYYFPLVTQLMVGVAAFLVSAYDALKEKTANETAARVIAAIVLLSIIGPSSYDIYNLWFNPYKFAKYKDETPWIVGGSSGQAWRQAIAFLQGRAAKGERMVVTSYVFDQNAQLLPVYLSRYPNVVTNGNDLFRSGYMDNQFKSDLPRFKASGAQVYLVTLKPDDPRPMKSFPERFGKIRPLKVFYGLGRSQSVSIYRL